MSDSRTRISSSSGRSQLLILGALVASLLMGTGCVEAPDSDDMLHATTPSVRAIFTEIGTRLETSTDSISDDALVQLIDNAEHTLDFAVMGFYRGSVVDAVERAWRRGVEVRFVGDARYLESGTAGYIVMEDLNIPMTVGNLYHIMHNKFFIIDGRWVLSGTGNITNTGFTKNDNNWLIVDSPQVAADFTAEFEQMFNGRFGPAKQPNDNGNTYQVGDTEVGVYFSPQEDTVGQLVEAIRSARESVQFFIFAFTKDEVGAAMIEKHFEFVRYNRCCDPTSWASLTGDERTACNASPAVTCEPFVTCDDLSFRFETTTGWGDQAVDEALAERSLSRSMCAEFGIELRERVVRGVIDRSQLHGNGPYHEIYRLLAFGVPMVMDGNRNSYNPGDYQAGGGRQHSKTMVIDAGRPEAVVLSGSFNWSSSATVSNDETLLVVRGERVAADFARFFDSLWNRGQDPTEMFVTDQTINPGDVIFNEVHWDGWNGDYDPTVDGPVFNDEYIELLNTTDKAINLSLFQITDRDDFILGFFPGTVIGPHERFLILDHNIVPYSDTVPQDGMQAFEGADFVMNTANDPRFLRLNLRNSLFRLELRDTDANVIDVAGDGGTPYFGGREPVGADEGCRTWDIECVEDEGVCTQQNPRFNSFLPDRMRNYSMERIHRSECRDDDSCEVIGPGDDPSSWGRAEAPGLNVRERFRECVYGTPGEINSIGTAFPEEDPDFRAPLAD